MLQGPPSEKSTGAVDGLGTGAFMVTMATVIEATSGCEALVPFPGRATAVTFPGALTVIPFLDPLTEP